MICSLRSKNIENSHHTHPKREASRLLATGSLDACNTSWPIPSDSRSTDTWGILPMEQTRSKTQHPARHLLSSCCKSLSVSPWQRLALRSRVCARELLPDSLKAVGYLSIMSLCTSFILLHSTSCYFMLHPCISRSANSMWPLLEHCLNTACILPRYVILRHLSPDNCCNLFIEYTCTAGKRWEKCTVCVTQSMHWQPDSSMHNLPKSIIKTSRLPDSLRIRLASGRSLPQCQKVGSSVQSFYILYPLYPLYPHITSYHIRGAWAFETFAFFSDREAVCLSRSV